MKIYWKLYEKTKFSEITKKFQTKLQEAFFQAWKNGMIMKIISVKKYVFGNLIGYNDHLKFTVGEFCNHEKYYI